MPLDTAIIERACNTIRRQVLDEYPDLTVQFIVYGGGGLARAIEAKRGELMDHPAGALFFPFLKKMTQSGKTPYGVCGIAWQSRAAFWRFFSRRSTLVCCLVCADDYDDANGLQYALYARVRQALALYLDPARAKDTRPQGFIEYKAAPQEAAWNDMLAEAFAALVLESQGQKASVRGLARRRCTAALEASLPGVVDRHPFPMLVDATMVVLGEMRTAGFDKAKPFAQAYAMSEEIGMTFDQETVLQWWAFTQPAQKMAWLGLDKNRILSAAVNTSEDPYARSTAYLVAETLGLEPAATLAGSFYNFFCDPEANERHHTKLCNDILETVRAKMDAADANAQAVLSAEITRNNTKLLSGEMIGWCAPALLTLTKNTPDPRKAFYTVADQINNQVLRALAEIIIALKQHGQPVTLETIGTAAREEPTLHYLDFEALSPYTAKAVS